ncbi:MAG: DciA family protein [Elusimicrobiales bacterium]|nr:DciA family protein [Elusimicrobiales bacterium]
MFLVRKSQNWSRIGHSGGQRPFRGFPLDRLPLLSSVWDREIGPLGAHCRLEGVEGDRLVVSASSAAAANELRLRGRSLVRALNKYFSRAWLRDIKVTGEPGR